MHSSRMRTVRCSGRLGVGVSAGGGVCLGSVCPRGSAGGCTLCHEKNPKQGVSVATRKLLRSGPRLVTVMASLCCICVETCKRTENQIYNLALNPRTDVIQSLKPDVNKPTKYTNVHKIERIKSKNK